MIAMSASGRPGTFGTYHGLMGKGFMGSGLRQFVMKAVLLSKICKRRTYPYELVREFSVIARKRRMPGGDAWVKNEVYNTLASLEKAGLIAPKADRQDGKIRKYYVPTEKGRNAVKAMRSSIRDTIKSMRLLFR